MSAQSAPVPSSSSSFAFSWRDGRSRPLASAPLRALHGQFDAGGSGVEVAGARMRGHEDQKAQQLFTGVLCAVGLPRRAPHERPGGGIDGVAAGRDPPSPLQDEVALVLVRMLVRCLRLPRGQDVDVGEEAGRLHQVVLCHLLGARRPYVVGVPASCRHPGSMPRHLRMPHAGSRDSG